MKKRKKSLMHRIWQTLVEFFTEEDEEEQKDLEGEISIKTLVIIFIIGLLIIGAFYLYFGTSKEADLKESLSITPADSNEELGYSESDFEKLQYNYSFLELNYEKLKYNYSLLTIKNMLLQQEIIQLNNTIINMINQFDNEITKCNNQILDFYTKMYPYEYITNHCQDCFIYLSLVENKNILMKIKYIIPYHNMKKWTLFLHKIEERLFNVEVNYGWVYVGKILPNVDWSNYSNITFFLKSDVPSGLLQLHFKEQDGDEWYYFDDYILSKEGWTGITIPFTRFSQPPWASHGNGKQELNSITNIGFTFTSFDRPLNKTVYFSVIDGEIFSLS